MSPRSIWWAICDGCLWLKKSIQKLVIKIMLKIKPSAKWRLYDFVVNKRYK